jgi:hypothetical protein
VPSDTPFAGIDRSVSGVSFRDCKPQQLTPELFEEMLEAYLAQRDVPCRLVELHHPECSRLSGGSCHCAASYYWVPIDDAG